MEGLFEVEGEGEVPEVDDTDRIAMDEINEQYNELVKEVGDKLDYQVLRYAVPMRSRRASESQCSCTPNVPAGEGRWFGSFSPTL